jgi:hypothetical protein
LGSKRKQKTKRKPTALLEKRCLHKNIILEYIIKTLDYLIKQCIVPVLSKYAGKPKIAILGITFIIGFFFYSHKLGPIFKYGYQILSLKNKCCENTKWVLLFIGT